MIVRAKNNIKSTAMVPSLAAGQGVSDIHSSPYPQPNFFVIAGVVLKPIDTVLSRAGNQLQCGIYGASVTGTYLVAMLTVKTISTMRQWLGPILNCQPRRA